MKRFWMIALAIFAFSFAFSYAQNSPDESKLSKEEREKLRQEVMDIQRQITSEYVRLMDRMRATAEKAQTLMIQSRELIKSACAEL